MAMTIAAQSPISQTEAHHLSSWISITPYPALPPTAATKGGRNQARNHMKGRREILFRYCASICRIRNHTDNECHYPGNPEEVNFRTLQQFSFYIPSQPINVLSRYTVRQFRNHNKGGLSAARRIQ